MSFRPVKDLYTRIASDENESSLENSTFFNEIKDISLMVKNSGDNSLCLIDELGKATNSKDGVALAWAISEHLSKNI